MTEYSRGAETKASGVGDSRLRSATLGLPLARALLFFKQGRYGDACDSLMPIRYDLVDTGGSGAQRGNQFILPQSFFHTCNSINFVLCANV
jgi:hypothetical protein